jgi:hypothetical protein
VVLMLAWEWWLDSGASGDVPVFARVMQWPWMVIFGGVHIRGVAAARLGVFFGGCEFGS